MLGDNLENSEKLEKKFNENLEFLGNNLKQFFSGGSTDMSAV